MTTKAIHLPSPVTAAPALEGPGVRAKPPCIEGRGMAHHWGLPDPKPDTGGDYYPTGLQERAAP